MTKVKISIFSIVILAMLAACTATPTPQPTATTEPSTSTPAQVDTPFVPATNTPEPTATPVVLATSISNYPAEGYGPTDFPDNVDPLTGMTVSDPQILNRRPIIIKVENLPREDRPQSGLSSADIVYEYYTEYGTTRFAAVFYGQDAEKVEPIRSARYSDVNYVQMYKGVFVFGSAYAPVLQRMLNSDFGNRLVLENSYSCPAVCRDNTTGSNFLMANTSALQSYLKTVGINNSKQDLTGMYFNATAPDGGQAADQLFVRYSGAIYNRWDYDPTTNKYSRFVDTQNDTSGTDPQYAQLTDAATGEPITADNVLIIQAKHTNTDSRPGVEVLDVSIIGTGPAYLARNGQLYSVKWERDKTTDVLHLVDDQGNNVPFNPGQTWIELMSNNTTISQDGNAWHFNFLADW